MKQDSIEEIIRMKITGAEADGDSADVSTHLLWDRLADKMHTRKPSRKILSYYKIAAAIVVLCCITALYRYNTKSSVPAIVNRQQPSNQAGKILAATTASPGETRAVSGSQIVALQEKKTSTASIRHSKRSMKKEKRNTGIIEDPSTSGLYVQVPAACLHASEEINIAY